MKSREMPWITMRSTWKRITPWVIHHEKPPVVAYRERRVRSALGGMGVSLAKSLQELPASQQGSSATAADPAGWDMALQEQPGQQTQQHRQHRLWDFVHFAAPMAARALAYGVFSEWQQSHSTRSNSTSVENCSFAYLMFIVSFVGVYTMFPWCIKNLIDSSVNVSKICCLLTWCDVSPDTKFFSWSANRVLHFLK